ncbi:TadE/TadG family type IV pilus assembly protein [uncultured Roseibium sp.]|uniref:TadE/TadG family type IV pilus assembly protein n=1 Tax=uncultured Roseibium sp. TaxID=1936171 RepID=UPI0026335FD6|nr:TadE/TadG family type IV pilus assembly protein [uncultured Roseibium sp.]
MNLGNSRASRRPKASSTIVAIWRRLQADTRAVSAVEFALILPLMLIILIGMEEATGALNQDRKVSRIANSVTDLVAQAQTVDKNDLQGIMDLGEKILTPYPATTLGITIASVTFDGDGDASVDWSYNNADGTPWAKGAVPPITLPGTVAVANTSIVVGQVSLTYTPTFAGIFTEVFERDSAIDLGDIYYLRPRLTNTVACSDC